MQPSNNTIAMLDSGMKEVGQLVFAKSQPQIQSVNAQYPCITQMSYNLQGQSSAVIQMLVGTYQVSDKDISNPMSLNKTLLGNAEDAQQAKANLPLTTFDYQAQLQLYDVSYIANRDFETNPKFANDPRYSLVFINNEVAIFKVKPA